MPTLGVERMGGAGGYDAVSEKNGEVLVFGTGGERMGWVWQNLLI
jgi:hypothetical protein